MCLESEVIRTGPTDREMMHIKPPKVTWQDSRWDCADSHEKQKIDQYKNDGNLVN